MVLFKKIFFAATAVSFMVSCGLPSYSTIAAPTVESTGDVDTLAFTPTSDADYYIVAYKLYWDSETSLRSSDENTIEDEDKVETGFDTLEDLDFVQMRNSSDTDSTGDYPDDRTDITLIWSGSGTITLTFDTSTGQLSVTNANNTDTLYRRVKDVNSSGNDTDDGDIYGVDFLSAEYDYLDSDSYEINGVSINRVGGGGDGDGIHADVTDIFGKSRFYGTGYDGRSIMIGVAVYSYTVSAFAEAVESVPVYLGYVTINPLYWDPN